MERHKKGSCYIIYVSVIVLNRLDRKKRKTISVKYVRNVRLKKKRNNVKNARKAINVHNLYLTKKEQNVKLYVGLIEAYRRKSNVLSDDERSCRKAEKPC